MRLILIVLMFGLQQIAFAECELCGDQRGKNLYQRILNEDISKSDFTGASLNQVMVFGLDKSFNAKKAKFDFADMKKAKFSKVDDVSKFEDSSWRGVDFSSANLENAKFLQNANVGLALINDQTKLPFQFKLASGKNAFLNLEWLGEFEIKGDSNSSCFMSLCFRRHPLLKKKRFKVSKVDVGVKSEILLDSIIKPISLKIDPSIKQMVKELVPEGIDFYPLSLSKGAVAALYKNLEGEVILKVSQSIEGNTYQREFKLKKKGYFKRSLKNRNIILEGYNNWKNDSNHLVEEPVERSLQNTMGPLYYLNKQGKSQLNVGLVYYGNFWKDEDLQRIKDMLKRRFDIATNGAVGLNVVYTEALDFRHKIENYPDYKSGKIEDKDRLERVWYYDNLGGFVLPEAYQEFKKTEKGKANYKKIDALLLITGAQFESLAFQAGKVAAIEQPREVAWGLANGGRTVIVPDEEIVDGLIHELGHVMFIGHASHQCWQPGMSLEEREACCAKSPAKDDVMSYCRDREIDSEELIHGFGQCNLDMIKNKVAPAIMSGGGIRIKNRSTCN